MTYPLISIIIPSFNQGQFIEATILSIVNQDYEKKEIIIIDGGSTDDSIKIIRKYKDHISYWVSEKDSGQSDAINKGLKIASGEIINWINSDDLLAKDALNIIANAFVINQEAALVIGKTTLFNDSISNTSSYKIIGDGSETNYCETIAKMTFAQPSAFFRRSALNKLGISQLDPSLHYGMDYDLYIQMLISFPFVTINENLSFYRIHSHSKSSTNTAGFYEDWRKVFSRFLRGYGPEANSFIEQLITLDLYSKDKKVYCKRKDLSKSDLNIIFSYHIANGYEHLYENLKFEELVARFEIVKKNTPEIFKKLRLSKYYWRAKYVPPALIRFFRIFTRQNSC